MPRPSRLSFILTACSLLTSVTVPASASAHADADMLAPSVKTVNCSSGDAVQLLTPAPGFNPLTATDAELEANALPPRPSGAAALAVWKHFVAMPNDPVAHCSAPTAAGPAGHRASVVAPIGVVGGVDTTANWAGYVADVNSYTDAFGAWTVPAANTAAGSDTYSSTWVGVGSGASKTSPLMQAGTESDNLQSPTGSYSLWWELVGGTTLDASGPIGWVSPGDSIYVHAHLSYNDDWVVAEDETSGLGKGQNNLGVPAAKLPNSIWPSDQAEWIEERTEIAGPTNGIFPPLAKVTSTFTGATAYGTNYSATTLDDLPYVANIMENCSSTGNNDEIAYPTAVTSSGGFSVAWREYGDASYRRNC